MPCDLRGTGGEMIFISKNSSAICEECGHFLMNHNPAGCMTTCDCKIQVQKRESELTAYRERLLAEIERLIVPGPTTNILVAGRNTALRDIKDFIEKEQTNE